MFRHTTASMNAVSFQSLSRTSILIFLFVAGVCLCSAKSTSLFPRRKATQQPLQSSISPKSTEAAWKSGIKNSLASSLAAASSKLLLAPLDTIKTLQQSERAMGVSSLSLLEAARKIVQRPKGVLELYVSLRRKALIHFVFSNITFSPLCMFQAGVGVAMVGSMPSVGLYFGIYSFCKKTFNSWDPNPNHRRQTLYIALSAAIGNTVASASRVPYEVVKQKLQTKVYDTFGDALRYVCASFSTFVLSRPLTYLCGIFITEIYPCVASFP